MVDKNGKHIVEGSIIKDESDGVEYVVVYDAQYNWYTSINLDYKEKGIIKRFWFNNWNCELVK